MNAYSGTIKSAMEIMVARPGCVRRPTAYMSKRSIGQDTFVLTAGQPNSETTKNI